MIKFDVVFDYFHDYESEQFAFYRIPKVLFTDDYFKNLTSDAKVLYGLMLDRMALSIKNKWIDQNNRVYIIFTLEQVMQYMNCGRDKGMKTLAELDTKKGIGLIERVKQGFGKPDIIYVKSFVMKQQQTTSVSEQPEEQKAYSQQENEFGESDLLQLEETTYRGRKKRPLEVEKSDLSRLEKSTSQGRKNRLIEVEESDSNNTDINDNNRNNINPINLSSKQETTPPEQTDVMEVMEAYVDIIKNNIEYDSLVAGCKVGEKEYIDEIVELIVEVLSVKRQTFVISGVEYPYQLVKNKLLKINSSHIRYVLECLYNNTTKIRNVKSYLLACVFNASSTINNYYRAEVNHDLYG